MPAPTDQPAACELYWCSSTRPPQRPLPIAMVLLESYGSLQILPAALPSKYGRERYSLQARAVTLPCRRSRLSQSSQVRCEQDRASQQPHLLALKELETVRRERGSLAGLRLLCLSHHFCGRAFCLTDFLGRR